MRAVKVVADSAERAGDLKTRLAGFFAAEYLSLDKLRESEPGTFTVIDIDLHHPAQVNSIRHWLKARPSGSEVVVSIDRASHFESVQAYAMGATCLMRRPLNGQWLHRRIFYKRSSLDVPAELDQETHDWCRPSACALQEIFAAAALGEAPSIESLNAVSGQIVDVIEAKGLSQWLDVIRSYHSQTHQHCLTVTAVAVAFGKQVGFSRSDTEKMASAGLIHDVGKAKIPLAILEKQTPLTEAEIALMQQHPILGYDILCDAPDLDSEMRDMVVHHHEYLDASGYPHALQGSEISDLVRVITIADVFSALIERRAYKMPLSGPAALEVLHSMGPKLDRALVRAFAPVARLLH